MIRTLLVLLVVLQAGRAQPRNMESLNAGWKFIRQDVAGADAADFDDSHWQSVKLPHTWNAFDGQDGGNDYYRGIGWYRRTLTLGPEHAGKRIFVKFDAASTVAHVYVNGAFAGMHKGGFSAFCFDVTPLVRLDTINLIAVKVSNAHDSTVAPLRGDFTIFGGLYRDVHLLVLEPVFISPLDCASSGVYVKQTEVGASRAHLEITTLLCNNTPGTKKATVVATIQDHGGRIVASGRSRVTLPSGIQQESLQNIVLERPRLWNGRHDPYLYRVIVELFDGRQLRDRVVEPLGIRFFRVDAENGFFLNGRPYRLHGVNRHQDRQDKGWAIGKKEFEEDYALIEEIGATTVRLAHYQHAKGFYDLCDRGGMIVWAELGLVDFVSDGRTFEECTRQQLAELIKQNYNHPSIVFWSLFNELIPDKNEDLYGRTVVGLNTLAHQLDPTRLTTMASRSMYDGNEFINTVTDLVAYNVYKGWYEEMPEDFAAYADSLHSRFPRHRIGIGEYGAGAGTTQHEVPPQKPRTTARWHPEEWQNVYHEAHWKAMAARPFLWGTYIWNMFDFASDSRLEGELPGRNDKGLVTFDRKIRKDAFFWYKANWNPEPMVHITSRRFSVRPPGQTEVKVYSNCDSVSLVLNGDDLGTKRSDDRMFVWHPVEFKTGENNVRAIGRKNGKTVIDTCSWQVK